MKIKFLLPLMILGMVSLANCKKSYTCEQVAGHTLTVLSEALGMPKPTEEKIAGMTARCDQKKLDQADPEAIDCFMNAHTSAEMKKCNKFDI